MMKYSIGIPTYRRPNDLRNAISSVLAQTVTDFELIICDNASGDETESVVGEFNDSRIRYYKNEENIGGPKNMQKCVENSLGEWFILLSDDDALFPEYLSFLEEGVASCPQATVFSTAYLYGNESKGILGKTTHYSAGIWQEFEVNSKKAVILNGEEVGISLLFEATIMHPVTALRRSTVQETGGYFSDFMYGSDLITFARVAAQGKVVFDYRIGGWYHAHSSNWSRSIPKIAQLNSRRKLNEIIIRELMKQSPEILRRGIDLLDKIPRRQKWKFLDEALVGGYPELQKQMLMESIAQKHGDSLFKIKMRSWFKMNKRIAFQRWLQEVSDREGGAA